MSAHLQQGDIRPYTFAGNSTITLQSGNTDRRYTYRVTRCKTNENAYFVKLLRGPDNTKDYSYIGCYFTDTSYFYPCSTWRDKLRKQWPPSMRAIAYFFEHLDDIPANLYVWRENYCASCGRKLTTPESISCGYGPECLDKRRHI